MAEGAFCLLLVQHHVHDCDLITLNIEEMASNLTHYSFKHIKTVDCQNKMHCVDLTLHPTLQLLPIFLFNPADTACE